MSMHTKRSKAWMPIFIAFALLFSTQGSKAQRQLVVVSYGGSYQDAQRKAFFEPFAKKYNVRIREETWAGDLAQLKAMVESGHVTWDVVDVESYMVLRGAEQNLFEKVDYAKVPKNELLPAAVNQYGVVTAFWSTILAYNSQRYSPDKHPTGWRDFWDSTKFSGTRALRKDPVANLEIALLAAGVTKDKLYPLDVDKAFASLDKIKSQIRVWWDAGEQPIQLLASGEVAISSAWNGRVHDAAKAGTPVALDWEEGSVSSDSWVIPRGGKNVDLAQQFLAFASSSGPQSQLPKYISYGPANKKAIESLSPALLEDLPTAPGNLEKQFFIDQAWWNQNLGSVTERWNKWLLQ